MREKGGKSNRSVTERRWEEGEVGKDRREKEREEEEDGKRRRNIDEEDRN